VRIVELDPKPLEELILIPYQVRTTTSRTSGPSHVSDIIRDIENTVTKRGQRRKYDDLSPDEQRRMGTYMKLGWAWEEVIRDALMRTEGRLETARFISPKEMEVDGIYGTIDWFDTQDWAVEEFKATWRSSNRPLDPDFWHWLVQIKAYCHMVEATFARLEVFFVNGDYQESGPQIKRFELYFTEREIADNWAMLKNHAKHQGWITGK